MTFKLLTMASAMLAASVAYAAPAPVLDFNGAQNGALIQNFYNGGTDSLGDSGVNYGVTFDGGIVQIANGLTYLTGVTAVHVAAGFAKGVTFNYSTPQSPYPNGMTPSNPGLYDFGSFLLDINGNRINGDFNFLGDTTSGYCQSLTGQFCLFGGAILSDEFTRLGGFTFAPFAAIDNIALGSIVPPPNEMASIPEPASIALLGLGLVGLVTARRKLTE